MTNITLQEMDYSDNDTCTCGMSRKDDAIFKIFQWWSEGVVQISVNAIGFLLNSICLWVLFSKDQKGLFNRTLAFLAVFDLMYNVLDILESIRRIHHDRNSCLPKPFYQTIHLYMWPQVLRPLRMIMMTASTYTTFILAMERYFAVSKPISVFASNAELGCKRVLRYIGPMVLFVTTFFIPLLFTFKTEVKYYTCVNGLLKQQLNHTSYCEILQNDTKSFNINSTNINNGQSMSNHSPILVLQYTDLRIDPNYVLYYKTFFCLNFGRNIIYLIKSLSFEYLKT